MSLIFKIFLLIGISVSSFAVEKIYLLPKDSYEVKQDLETFIKSTQNTIDILVYNFEYKKIAKLLKQRSKKGIKINIIFDGKKIKNKKSQYKKLCKLKNISCKVINNKKQHIKLIIFDKRLALFGSANLTKDSFNKNLELIYVTDYNKIVKKLNNNFTDF
jgi:phosphatidylserine/phosphatidylglycerophosphate/cardiolipin synthase-like enzyme